MATVAAPIEDASRDAEDAPVSVRDLCETLWSANWVILAIDMRTKLNITDSGNVDCLAVIHDYVGEDSWADIIREYEAEGSANLRLLFDTAGDRMNLLVPSTDAELGPRWYVIPVLPLSNHFQVGLREFATALNAELPTAAFGPICSIELS